MFTRSIEITEWVCTTLHWNHEGLLWHTSDIYFTEQTELIRRKVLQVREQDRTPRKHREPEHGSCGADTK